MWKKVENYSLNFHNKPRRTAIHLKLEDNTDAVMDHLSIEELNTLGTLLREEAQVWYHSTRGDLVAHSAPLHEEELD
ncbi:MAG: hypothetical protein OQK94_03635 [Gammaproteobacteria bacterium]|nr:hypothetical protein [Gammaproteobacteria bacterium]MCW8840169.1 hypothetical protein [Gammaproteobacteria bacterium]MCW8972074.1 hypothetical protein [Gammaproteobacteria bacterium]MCW8993587.1 hypothetical protein [Gammaproteobacteria bacterium]